MRVTPFLTTSLACAFLALAGCGGSGSSSQSAGDDDTSQGGGGNPDTSMAGPRTRYAFNN